MVVTTAETCVCLKYIIISIIIVIIYVLPLYAHVDYLLLLVHLRFFMRYIVSAVRVYVCVF